MLTIKLYKLAARNLLSSKMEYFLFFTAFNFAFFVLNCFLMMFYTIVLIINRILKYLLLLTPLNAFPINPNQLLLFCFDFISACNILLGDHC